MPSTATKPRRPVLRYHGGKFGNHGTTADWVVSHLPKHRVYVEPFGGAASVLMRKPRSKSEVYNDLDRAVAAVFQVLATPYMAEALEKKLRSTPYARSEFEYAQSYIGANREAGFLLRDPVEHARLMLVASFMGHGSAGLRGKTSTGFRASESEGRLLASSDWANYRQHLDSFKSRLAGVAVESRPWRDVADRYDGEGTLFYLDPPYEHALRSSSKSDGYHCDFERGDHEALATWCAGAEGMIALSHYDSPFYRKMYEGRGWQRHEKRTRIDSGGQRTECLWLNPAAQEHQRQHNLFD